VIVGSQPRFDYDREHYTCALYRMGICCQNGYGGLKKDFDKGLEFIEKSAAMGRREAQKFLKTASKRGNAACISNLRNTAGRSRGLRRNGRKNV